MRGRAVNRRCQLRTGSGGFFFSNAEARRRGGRKRAQRDSAVAAKFGGQVGEGVVRRQAGMRQPESDRADPRDRGRSSYRSATAHEMMRGHDRDLLGADVPRMSGTAAVSSQKGRVNDPAPGGFMRCFRSPAAEVASPHLVLWREITGTLQDVPPLRITERGTGGEADARPLRASVPHRGPSVNMSPTFTIENRNVVKQLAPVRFRSRPRFGPVGTFGSR